MSTAACSALAQSPGGGQTTLPELTVEAKKQAPKAAKKTAPQTKGTAPQAPAPSATPEVETATSPVKGYVARQSATGTKTDTPLQEIPQSISVVGTEQMGDQGVQNLQEAVRYTPGVMADGYGFDTRSDTPIIRGVPGALFVDGLRTSYGYYVNTAMIEPFALERLEVLRGPSSMLYGQTSAGGIINGISKLPSTTPRGEIGVEYGSFNFKQLKVDMTGPITTDAKWLYRITGLVRDTDTQVDYVENDRVMLQPSITYRPTNNTSITLLGNFRKDNADSVQQFMPHLGTLYPHPTFGRVARNSFMGEPNDYYDTESQSGSLIVDHKFSNGLRLHHATRYTHTDVNYDSTLPALLRPSRIDFIGLGALLNVANSPFLDADKMQIARTRIIENHTTDVFNTDTNLTAVVDTGGVLHKLTAGADYMKFAHTRERAAVGLARCTVRSRQPALRYSFWDKQIGLHEPYDPSALLDCHLGPATAVRSQHLKAMNSRPERHDGSGRVARFFSQRRRPANHSARFCSGTVVCG